MKKKKRGTIGAWQRRLLQGSVSGGRLDARTGAKYVDKGVTSE